MKTSTKILVDRGVGPAILLLARGFYRLRRTFRNPKKDREVSRIVVCKFLGLGSIIQSTPLLQTLKENYPNAQLIYLSSTANKSLVRSIKVIDEAIFIDDKSLFSIIISCFYAVKKLLFSSIDIFVDLELHSHFSGLFMYASGAERLIKMSNTAESPARKNVAPVFLDPLKPVSESYLKVAERLNCRNYIHELYHFSKLPEIELDLKKRYGLQPDFIIINPNASDLRLERKWPAERFSLLIDHLLSENPSLQFVLIGSSNEVATSELVIQNLDAKWRSRVIVTTGQLTIPELLSLIALSARMITNDTGPMHLSFALAKPTICLFGPADPVQFGNHRNAIPVYHHVSCSPCVHQFVKPPCQGNNICMKGISVDDVVKAFKSA
jgi:ADP-heptose:LPS heptosyltransferase